MTILMLAGRLYLSFLFTLNGHNLKIKIKKKYSKKKSKKKKDTCLSCIYCKKKDKRMCQNINK